MLALVLSVPCHLLAQGESSSSSHSQANSNSQKNSGGNDNSDAANSSSAETNSSMPVPAAVGAELPPIRKIGSASLLDSVSPLRWGSFSVGSVEFGEVI